jgi:F-box protein 21
MRSYGNCTGTQFSNIMNSFPHHYLSPDGHQSLPLSLVHVFCALCNRLGLDGRALDFPMRVLARVMARPDHDEQDIIVDVYGSSEPNGKAILTESEGIPDMLRVSGTPLDQKDAYLEPGKPVPLLLRTTRNMINRYIFTAASSILNYHLPTVFYTSTSLA